MTKMIDMTGRRCGRLTVIKKMPADGNSAKWLCKCDCGGEAVVKGFDLRRGHTTSCGCYHTEVRRRCMSEISSSNTGERNPAYKHGGVHENQRLYWVWAGMIRRCTTPNNRHYHCYGARGIKVCDEWRKDFAAFRSWALANGYIQGLTIERIDVNGNYCPDNCTWIPKGEQLKNRRPSNEWRNYHG